MTRARVFPGLSLLSAGFIALSSFLAEGGNEPLPIRKASESVNDAQTRQLPGLQPNENLLFNGWGLTPAGQQVEISDMPLKMVPAPDGKYLVTVSGGYNERGLTILDVATKKVAQFVPLNRCWNGLVFTGLRRLLVTGGNTGLVYVFDYADGAVTARPSIKPLKQGGFLAGIAVNPSSGKVYVCNEGAQEVLVLNGTTLALEQQIAVGEHPHSCVVAAGNTRLYVSNWGSRSVSVIDLAKGRLLQNVPVGLRPNDMALARDGRLFVACSGDNTVHVIDTGVLDKTTPEATPDRRPRETAREIISTSLYPDSPEGSTPDAVAVAPDGKTLFVANADNNSVAVVNITDSKDSRIEGKRSANRIWPE